MGEEMIGETLLIGGGILMRIFKCPCLGIGRMITLNKLLILHHLLPFSRITWALLIEMLQGNFLPGNMSSRNMSLLKEM